MDEPAKKRKKSIDSDNSSSVATNSIPEMAPQEEIVIKAEAEEQELEQEQETENQIDVKIEEEEKKADNMVIRDLMGSVKPEPMKVT